MVPEKETDNKQPWRTIYEVIDDDYFEKSDVKFPKTFLIKCNKQFNEPDFILVKVRKYIQQVVLEHICFHILLKLNGHLLENQKFF